MADGVARAIERRRLFERDRFQRLYRMISFAYGSAL